MSIGHLFQNDKDEVHDFLKDTGSSGTDVEEVQYILEHCHYVG